MSATTWTPAELAAALLADDPSLPRYPHQRAELVAEVMGHQQAVLWACDAAELAAAKWLGKEPCLAIQAARAWAHDPCDHNRNVARWTPRVDAYSTASRAAAQAAKAVCDEHWPQSVSTAVEWAARATQGRGQPAAEAWAPCWRLAAERLEAL